MGRWTMVGAVVTVLAVSACANQAEESELETGAAEMAATAVEPACEPSEQMAVEGRTSPYDSATISIDGGIAKVCYGRPTLRGRTMIGGEAVPYGELWRTGANEPTIIHLTDPASIAGLSVEPGSYSLYTIPQEGDEWTLIVNRSTSQWGHESRYTPAVESQEVGRVPVQVDTTEDTIEQLTFRPMEDGTGLLLEWQNSRVRIPITPAG